MYFIKVIIKFRTLEDMHEILHTGPYTISNKSIILKAWSSDFKLDKEFLTQIPLWNTLPNLPMSCWGCGSLDRIASSIDKPLYAEECTTKQS